MSHVGLETKSLDQILEKPSSLMLYDTIRKAQGATSGPPSPSCFNELISFIGSLTAHQYFQHFDFSED